jgi:hypothetical protein
MCKWYEEVKSMPGNVLELATYTEDVMKLLQRRRALGLVGDVYQGVFNLVCTHVRPVGRNGPALETYDAPKPMQLLDVVRMPGSWPRSGAG